MKTLNKIVRLVTLPGVLIKAFWERIFANLTGIEVKRASVAGHISHGEADFVQLVAYCMFSGLPVLITGLPLLIFGFGILGPLGALPARGSAALIFAVAVAALYLGLSLLSNIYPSIEDAKMLWAFASVTESKLGKIVGYPFAAVMLIGAHCETWGLCALMWFGGAAAYFLNYVFGAV